ncbi:unnamed protein product [Larinioides sclopetarius]|uniref:Single domain-containing protein n=1 Tax=Larinioides sclopetarius TaxID=280406 RepID=A0AAV2BCQ7_9ARAC
MRIVYGNGFTTPLKAIAKSKAMAEFLLVTRSTATKNVRKLSATKGLSPVIRYCEGESYGRIPVGEEGFDDSRCERIECSQGFRHVVGCGKVLKPEDPRCRIVDGEGHYPHCCPDIKCDLNVV